MYNISHSVEWVPLSTPSIQSSEITRIRLILSQLFSNKVLSMIYLVEVLLFASDGKRFILDKNVARLSEFMSKKIDEKGPNESNEDIEITLADVNSNTLSKVVQWCNKYSEALRRPASVLDTWQKEYFEDNRGMLFEIMALAYNLEIQSLVKAASEFVPEMIRNTLPKELSQ